MQAVEVEESLGFCGTDLGGDAPQRQGERPFIPLSARVELALAAERYNTARQKWAVLFGPLAHTLATCKHAIWRAVRYGDFSEPWCTCIPAYTGGEEVAQRPVAVDGKLRTPACFGGMSEPWAQLGGEDCGDTADVLERVVDVSPARAVRVLVLVPA